MNLRERRKELGLTQTEVAIKVGVSLVSYQMWERGVTRPNEENEPKLKKALEME